MVTYNEKDSYMVNEVPKSRVLMREIGYWSLPVVFVFLPVYFSLNNGFGFSQFVGIVFPWLPPVLLTFWLLKFGLFQNSTKNN